ncbi:MAG: hypothetical protein PHY15_01105 [Eubacteriales bacterium]|nr:hypothetical protein [Eubacteriales bacterium]MDD4474345.1 hypothetical protein [Eubacteriales bacterium]
MCDWIDRFWEKHNLFYTPIIISKDNEYRGALKEIFQKLEDALIEVNAEDHYVEEVKKYRSVLLFAVDQYYCGYIFEAQHQMDELILEVCDSRLAVSHINNSISFCTYLCEQDVQFFRARCNEKITDYKGKEMLHIPFSKRSIVKSERFSILGLPCLYLGTSSYVCWMEMGRPADHMFNVSPVTLDNTQQILNLAVNFRDFCWSKKYSDVNRKSIFKLFLLSLATSFKVKESNRVFKSEYIISQLVMLACMKKGLSGLTYYSKQVENDIFAYSIGVNLALFALYSPEKELSDICNHISISDSFNYSMYKQLTVPQTFRRANLRIDKIGNAQNIGSYDRQYPYKETEFYLFDHYLYAYLKPDEASNVYQEN